MTICPMMRRDQTIPTPGQRSERGGVMDIDCAVVFLLILSIIALSGFQAMVDDLVHKAQGGEEEEER